MPCVNCLSNVYFWCEHPFWYPVVLHLIKLLKLHAALKCGTKQLFVMIAFLSAWANCVRLPLHKASLSSLLFFDWLMKWWSKRSMTGFGGARRLCARYLKKYKSHIAAARVWLIDLVQYGHDCRWIWRETVVFKLSTCFSIGLLGSQSCGFHLFAMYDLQQHMAGAGSLAVILQPAFLPFVGKWFISLFFLLV